MVPQEDKCLTAVFKEKEPKITKARDYFKLTIPMRLCQVATEKNIADSLFPYESKDDHGRADPCEYTLSSNGPVLSRGDQEHLPELRLSALVSQDGRLGS